MCCVRQLGQAQAWCGRQLESQIWKPCRWSCFKSTIIERTPKVQVRRCANAMPRRSFACCGARPGAFGVFTDFTHLHIFALVFKLDVCKLFVVVVQHLPHLRALGNKEVYCLAALFSLSCSWVAVSFDPLGLWWTSCQVRKTKGLDRRPYTSRKQVVDKEKSKWFTQSGEA